jgi:zinc protease
MLAFLCAAAFVLGITTVRAQAPKAAPKKTASTPAARASAPAAKKQAAASDIPQLKFEKYTLANGLEVILLEDRSLPVVAVNLWYHVGPANEAAGRTGFAHLFEHMMFQGSKHVPGDSFFKYLEGAGSPDTNGTTDFDRTNYMETVPSNQLELALWLESDRMGYLLDTLDQANLSNQQDVVRNERRQAENAPYQIAEEQLYHTVFPAGHPYYAYVIGSHADIQAAKLDDVKNFFKLYYAPNNASLALVGDFSTPVAKRMIEKYFGTLRRGEPVPAIAAKTPPITSERRRVVTDKIELPRAYMAWITSPIFKPGDADALIAAEILGGGKSGRLYKKLVYEKQIAQDVNASQYSLALGSLFSVNATARPGKSVTEIEEALDVELQKLRTDGPDDAEVERARNVIETRIIRGLEQRGGFEGVANRLNYYNHYLKNPGYLAEDIARFRAVTPASVQKFVREQLKSNARVVLHCVPGEKDLGAEVPTPPKTEVAAGTGAEAYNKDEAWRANAPKPGPARALQLPVPKTFKLANGMTVILNERSGLPVVAAYMVVRTGSEANPPERPGLASFSARMLDEGTTTRSSLQIADEVAQLGATFGTSSSPNASYVSGGSLKKNFPALLRIMADVTLNPSFPSEELERQRAIRLGDLVQEKDNPIATALRLSSAVLFGPKHPYGFPEIGTEASLKAFQREDIVEFWKQHYRPDNAALVVAGNITGAEVKAIAEKAFGAWKAYRDEKPVRSVSAPETTKANLVIVDKPAAPQTVLLAVTIGPARSTPDYPAVSVMNTILGGLFSSRLNLNLREQHGYSYGAGSFFFFNRMPGPFLAYALVRTDVTAASVTEMMKEIGKMSDTLPSAEEMTLAKDSLVRSLPFTFETSDGVAGSFINIYNFDLGLDYYAKYPAMMQSVTPEQVQAGARKHIAPGKIIIVAVGDRGKIEAELKKLNLGTIEIRDEQANIKQ